jgi:hypothetical protein
MDNKPKGGRGKTAPYETAMVRCPLPVKTEVESLIQAYRETILRGEDWEGFQAAVKQSEPRVKEIKVKVTKEEAIAKMQEIADRQKKGKTQMKALLDFVYGDTEGEVK